MITSELRETMLKNARENTVLLTRYERAVPLRPSPHWVEVVNVVGGGADAKTWFKKGVVIGNQSSSPYIMYTGGRVDYIVVTDPGEAVLERLAYVLEEQLLVRWIVATTVSPRLLKQLIAKEYDVQYFVNALDGDGKFNNAVNNCLPPGLKVPSVVQMGSVVNASIAIGHLLFPRAPYIGLSGVAFGWKAGCWERVPAIRRNGDGWSAYAELEHGECIYEDGSLWVTTAPLKEYRKQFEWLVKNLPVEVAAYDNAEILGVEQL